MRGISRVWPKTVIKLRIKCKGATKARRSKLHLPIRQAADQAVSPPTSKQHLRASNYLMRDNGEPQYEVAVHGRQRL
jgi:hypothetical protein